jgi:hypothetical protein
MKKIIFTLVIAFLFFACDNGAMEKETNPFLGAWEDSGNGVHGGFLFTEIELKEYYFSDNPTDKIERRARFVQNPPWYATYSYDDTTLTIRYSENPNNPSSRPDKEWEDIIPYDIKGDIKLDMRGNGILYLKTTMPTLY